MTLRYKARGGVTLKSDLLFPSCETLGSVINILGPRCSCGQDTMMPQGRRDLIPDSVCEFNSLVVIGGEHISLTKDEAFHK